MYEECGAFTHTIDRAPTQPTLEGQTCSTAGLDATLSVIRTVVPAVVGYVLVLGVRWGLYLDTTALNGLIEPVAAAGAAIFFAPSKAGRDIRLHTASNGPLGTPLSTHIHPHPVAAFAVTVRSRTPEALRSEDRKGL